MIYKSNIRWCFAAQSSIFVAQYVLTAIDFPVQARIWSLCSVIKVPVLKIVSENPKKFDAHNRLSSLVSIAFNWLKPKSNSFYVQRVIVIPSTDLKKKHSLWKCSFGQNNKSIIHKCSKMYSPNKEEIIGFCLLAIA